MGGNSSRGSRAGGSSGRLLNCSSIQSKHVLLLGCGESGKTTLFNQWKRKARIAPLSAEDRARELRNAVEVVKRGFLGLMEAISTEENLLRGIDAGLTKNLTSELNKFAAFPMGRPLANSLLTFYNSAGVRGYYLEKFSQTAQGRLVRYFAERLNRITDDNYVPDEDDFLHLHSRTTGVVNEEFHLDVGHTVTVSDFGGQRSERKKWETFYRSANCMIYTCDASDFDQTLFENNKVNRLQESFRVWTELTDDPDQDDLATILIFTKTDLLAKKFEKLSKSGEEWWKNLPLDLGKEMETAPSVSQYLDILQTKFVDSSSASNIHPFQVNLLDNNEVGGLFKMVSGIVLQPDV